MAFEILVIESLGVSLNADPTATLLLERLEMPEPAPRAQWVSAADSDWAALTGAPLHENRVITARVRVNPQANIDAAFDAVGALIDKFQKDGAVRRGKPGLRRRR